jgi:hypothetical protein
MNGPNGMVDINHISGTSARRSYQRLGWISVNANLRVDHRDISDVGPRACVSLMTSQWSFVSITSDGMVCRWPHIDQHTGYALTSQGKLREVNER